MRSARAMILGIEKVVRTVSQACRWNCGQSGGESKQIWVSAGLEERSCHRGTGLLAGCIYLGGSMHAAVRHMARLGRLPRAWLQSVRSTYCTYLRMQLNSCYSLSAKHTFYLRPHIM